MEEEAGRLDGIPAVNPQQFTFFSSIADNRDVIKAYDTMQNQYVLRESDRIPYNDALSAIHGIYGELQKCYAWTNYEVSEKLRLIIDQKKAEQLKPKKTNPGKCR